MIRFYYRLLLLCIVAAGMIRFSILLSPAVVAARRFYVPAVRIIQRYIASPLTASRAIY